MHTLSSETNTQPENSKFLLTIRFDTKGSSRDLVLAYCCNLGAGGSFLFPISLLHFRNINYLY